MTTEKMPDELWADGFNDWFSKPRLESDPIGFKRDKYLRAEPVEELLKKIRDQVEFCKKHDHTPALDKTMILIDKFLGEK